MDKENIYKKYMQWVDEEERIIPILKRYLNGDN